MPQVNHKKKFRIGPSGSVPEYSPQDDIANQA
jgi:hypothetical protein